MDIIELLVKSDWYFIFLLRRGDVIALGHLFINDWMSSSIYHRHRPVSLLWSENISIPSFWTHHASCLEMVWSCLGCIVDDIMLCRIIQLEVILLMSLWLWSNLAVSTIFIQPHFGHMIDRFGLSLIQIDTMLSLRTECSFEIFFT